MAFKKFKDKSRKNKKTSQPGQPATRVRLPRNKEVLGKVEQRYGGMKMLVLCADGKSRNSRVPGRMRRRLWLREGDIVLVEPWEFDNNRADIIFKYNPSAVNWLKNKGYLKNLEEF